MPHSKREVAGTSILNATASDLSAIVRLLAELADAIDKSEPLNLQTIEENCRAILGDLNARLMVAKQGDRVVGLVNFSIRRTALHPSASGLIEELVVAKSHRGKGIGEKLVEAAVQECRILGCCELEVSTEKSNTRAREFYRRCGFQEDAVLLEMDLRPTNVKAQNLT